MAEPKVLPPVEGPIFDDEDDILAGLDVEDNGPPRLTAAELRNAIVGPQTAERPPGLTNSEWLHRQNVAAQQRQAAHDYVQSGRAAQLDAERAEQERMRRAAAEPGVPPNAPPPPNQPTGPVDIYFGHEQEILPPVPGTAPVSAARLRHRYEWNAIAADVATGENELTLTQRHGITVKALRRALRRSENFREMVDWHRRHRANTMESTIEQAAERILPRAFKRAIEENDIYRAAAVVQMVGTLGNTSRRNQRDKAQAGAQSGANVVQIGPNLVQIGSQRYRLVPVDPIGPVEPQISAIPAQTPRGVPDFGSGAAGA